MTILRDVPLFDPVPDPLSSHEQSVAADWVRQYVLNELPEPERNRFEEHFFECSACSDRVRTAYLLLRGVEATLQRDLIRPDRVLERVASRAGFAAPPIAPPPKRRVPLVPLAVAAAALLTVAFGYQNLSQFPALRLRGDPDDSPQSSPVLQLSETRSETDAVKKAPHISLILSNVTGAVFSFYDCELRDDTGKLVRNFRVPAVPGEEWELRMPTRNLPPDRYTLRVQGTPVRDPKDPGGTSDGGASEFHFVLEK